MFLIGYYYKKLAFFPDDEIKNKFLEAGLKEKELIWFTRLELILDELSKIENEKGIIVYPFRALGRIKIYTEQKIDRIVFNWAKRKFRINYLDVIKNFFRQQKYHESSGKGGSPTHFFNDMYNQAILQTPDKELLDKVLMKANKGLVDSIQIPKLMEDAFYPKKIKTSKGKYQFMSETEFIWRLSDLIVLIKKDKKFMPYDDYIEIRDRGGTYPRYIVGKIKKLGKRTIPFKNDPQFEIN